MHVRINNKLEDFSEDNLTVEDLVKLKNIPEQGTAIALNGKLIIHSKWGLTKVNENDDLVIISAAFGG